MITLKAKLVEYTEEFGGYIVYVFENLEFTDWTNKYIMCIRYPNWDQVPFAINSEGYLTFTLIEAGNKYYDVRSGENKIYTYTHNRFDKFILIQEKLVDEKIVV